MAKDTTWKIPINMGKKVALFANDSLTRKRAKIFTASANLYIVLLEFLIG